METVASKQQIQLMSSFMEIAVGQTAEIALHCLKATSWHLEDAINLFLIARRNPNQAMYYQELQTPHPLPSMVDTLYDYSMYHTPSVAVCPEEMWYSTSELSDSRWSSLYRPLNLLFDGSFEDARATASREDLWLLVNIQSTTEIASHTLDQDLWSNEVVSQAIGFNFILWQVFDHTNEGQRISSFYKIDSASPVVLLVDPITSQKMHTWSGMIEPEVFLEDLMKYIDAGPHEHFASLTSNKRIKTEKICVSSNHAYDDDQDMSTFLDNHFGESGQEKTVLKV